jgi:hypothetical protein
MTEERKRSCCVQCHELKDDPEDFYDGLRRRVKKDAWHLCQHDVLKADCAFCAAKKFLDDLSHRKGCARLAASSERCTCGLQLLKDCFADAERRER